MAARALFQGVVTFLMTDVEGSTRLWEQNSAAMAEAMAIHDALAEQVVTRHGGIVVKERGEGDALFCVFDRASAAVRAAVEVQQSLAAQSWPTASPIKIRCALHAGEPELRAGDYYGPVVNRCARLRSICFGEQIILSEAVRGMIQSLDREGYQLLDLGLHRLKDLSTPEQVFQVNAAGLPTQFPPLLSIGNSPNNLPQHASSFVGREKESSEVHALIQKHRLVTLVGPGGTGKTRLSQHVAEGVVGEFPDGVWVVELDRLNDAAGLVGEISQVLKIAEVPGTDPLQGLLDNLRSKKLLLLVDNCEHLREGVAQFVNGCLRHTESVRILGTSREPLGVSGETLFRVPSLGTPREDDALDPLAMMGYESVRLFMERGQSVRSDLVLTEENAASVGRICRQLDGIPFALELAAARARALSVEQIAERIDDRFRILGKGDTSRASRQHTLRALIDWSYESLSPEEQAVLNRLSIFVGGCTLESSEKVVAFDGIDEFDVMDHLISLVDKSLVSYDADLQRYRLLETIRQYGKENLAQGMNGAELEARYCEYFFEQAKLASAGLKGRDPKAWMDLIDAEIDNFRLAYRLLQGTPQKSAELVTSLFRYFDAQAIYAEPREQLLAVRESLNQTENAELFGIVHQVLGNLARRQGDFEAAEMFLATAAKVYEANGNHAALSATAINLATIYLFLGRLDEALATASPVLPVCESLGDHRALVTLHLTLGNIHSGMLQQIVASDHFEQALNLSKKHGLPDLQLYAQVNLGMNLSKRGEYRPAVTQLSEVLKLAHSMSIRTLVMDVLRFLGQAMIGAREPVMAARLYGLEDRLRERAGVKLSPSEGDERDEDISRIRIALGESAAQEFEWSKGVPIDDALVKLIGELPN